MGALFLANVGNRDVWLDGEVIPPREARAQTVSVAHFPQGAAQQ